MKRTRKNFNISHIVVNLNLAEIKDGTFMSLCGILRLAERDLNLSSSDSVGAAEIIFLYGEYKTVLKLTQVSG